MSTRVEAATDTAVQTPCPRAAGAFNHVIIYPTGLLPMCKWCYRTVLQIAPTS